MLGDFSKQESYSDRPYLPGMGSAAIKIAVLDGPVDTAHACFDGAALSSVKSLVPNDAIEDDPIAEHGTLVASVIFGQPGSAVEGLAPDCTGIVIPVYSGGTGAVTQLDLARAIDIAIDEGVHIINVSGGQLTDAGEAETWLTKAVARCEDNNVLIVAAAGNDGCECLHVPAALPAVLAVGAVDRDNRPLEFSNWGGAYQARGIMAPGQDILGAKPGGGVTRASGTSFAAPIVTSAAALLLSDQVERGQTPDPALVRDVILKSALPCSGGTKNNTDRCLAGRLNLPGAFELLARSKRMTEQASHSDMATPSCACEDIPTAGPQTQPDAQAMAAPDHTSAPAAAVAPAAAPAAPDYAPVPPPVSAPAVAPSAVTPSTDSGEEDATKVYALGVLGYDFGSEARRDSFKQLMPSSDGKPPNPYDARQMVDYIKENPAECRSLIWTLNIELTPIYAIEPSGPYAREIYDRLTTMLNGEILSETDADYIERVSLPGALSSRTVRLFSGQTVPVIEPQTTRMMYGWKTNLLVQSAVDSAGAESEKTRESLDGFLNRIYYDLRNLGKTSKDRALNFSVTNAFQVASTFGDAISSGMQLDEISVEKSPFGRMDSDCWDIKMKFFDPENSRRAKVIYRFTVDVSDLIPVTVGEVRRWTSAA